MRYIFIILLAVFCFSFHKDDDDVIVWSKNRKLSWDDYKGKPQRRFAAASTVYSLNRYIDKESDGTATAQIKAYFFCNDSWKKSSWINDDVLAHEQKHFDIVELYARKFRKQMSEIIFADYKSADRGLDSLYHIINKEMDEYQDKYDDETDGSMNGEEQKKWEKKITAEIESLNKYENYSVTVKLKSPR